MKAATRSCFSSAESFGFLLVPLVRSCLLRRSGLDHCLVLSIVFYCRVVFEFCSYVHDCSLSHPFCSPSNTQQLSRLSYPEEGAAPEAGEKPMLNPLKAMQNIKNLRLGQKKYSHRSMLGVQWHTKTKNCFLKTASYSSATVKHRCEASWRMLQ